MTGSQNEDIEQEVYIRTWKNIDKYKEENENILDPTSETYSSERLESWKSSSLDSNSGLTRNHMLF